MSEAQNVAHVGPVVKPIIADLPTWIAERFAAAPEARRAPKGVELDTEFAKAEARRWLALQPLAASGNASDTFFRYAARLKDLGVSDDTSIAMLHEFNPSYDEDDIAVRVGNAWKHGQNQPGSDTPQPDEKVFAGVEVPEPAPLGEPVDIFDRIAAKPILTREMLPDAPAMVHAFDVAERQGVDPAITVAAMLATCAAAITDEIKIIRKVNDDSHTERAHANFLIGEGVGGGKSPAIKAMTAPLRAAQMRQHEDHARQMKLYETAMKLHKKAETAFLVKYGGAENVLTNDPTRTAEDAPLAPVKPAKRYLVMNDATIEGVRDALLSDPHGFLNEQDEVTGFIAGWDAYRHDGSHGKDRAFWLQTDGGGPFFVNRAEKAEGGGGGVTVSNLSCCFIGGIQLDKLRELAPRLTDDGFIQRSFVILAASDRREQDRAPDHAAEQAYRHLVDRLAELGAAAPIRLSVEAHRWRQEVERAAEDRIIWPATPRAMRDHLKKWRGKFVRLLLLFHVVECVSRGETVAHIVSSKTAERARDFMLDFVLPHQLRFYTAFFDKADAIKTDAQWIAGHILARRLPQITMRDIGRAYHLDPEAEGPRITAAMKTLEVAGWAAGPEHNPAKRSTCWQVNPLVHVRFAERAARELAERTETMRRITEAGARLRAARPPRHDWEGDIPGLEGLV